MNAHFTRDLLKSFGKNFGIYLKSQLKDFNLTKGELHLLHYSCKMGSVQQKDLAKIFHVNKSTTARKVKKLIKKGYLQRSIDPEDKRKYIITPTKKGTQLSEDIRDILLQWHKKITSSLSEEEVEIFQTIGKKIIENSEKHIERIKNNE